MRLLSTLSKQKKKNPLIGHEQTAAPSVGLPPSRQSRARLQPDTPLVLPTRWSRRALGSGLRSPFSLWRQHSVGHQLWETSAFMLRVTPTGSGPGPWLPAPDPYAKALQPVNCNPDASWGAIQYWLRKRAERVNFFPPSLFIFRCAGSLLYSQAFSSCSMRATHWSGFSCCGAQTSRVASGLTCPMICGIFPDRELNLCPLYWQADSYPLGHEGSPCGHQFWSKIPQSLFPHL